LKKYWIILIFTLSISAEIHLIATQGCPFNVIDKKTVKKLFMRKSLHYKETPIIVLDNRDYYNEFIQTYIKKNPTKMNIYWTRMIFTGTRKPPKKISEKELQNMITPQNSCLLSYTLSKTIKGWKNIHVTP